MNEESQSQSSSDCQLRRTRPNFPSKDNYENTTEHDLHPANDTSENTDTSSCQERITNNTLPSRKAKKRMDILSVKSIIPNANFRTNVQNIFNNKTPQPSYPEEQQEEETSEEHSYQEPNLKPDNKNSSNMDQTQQCRFLPRLQGVENAAFQNQEAAAHQQKPEPTESEVYFADVSSCCNISVRNDGQDSSLYDEALEAQKPRLISLQCVHKQQRSEPDNPVQLQNANTNFQESTSYNENEDYLAQRIGKRQMSTRSRLPFPLPNPENMSLSELGTDQCLQLISKDISQNSLGSVQTPMTESTDDGVSPMTPSFPQNECCYFPENTNHEQHNPNNRHRNYPNDCIDQFLAPDAQYEIIQQQTTSQNFRQPSNYNEDTSSTTNPASFSNLTNTISGLNNFNNHNYPSHSQNYNPAVGQNFNTNFNPSSSKNIPPKTLNLNANSPRRGIGSNISTLIQNLGVNPVGLLYGEANSTDEDVQAQACHSDGTMDSGWQSGSEKQDPTRNDSAADTSVQVQRPVNV